MTGQDDAKRVAGERAIAEYLADGLRVGLGSGTTSRWFVRTLAKPVADGLTITGVVTSQTTAEVAAEAKVPLADLNDVLELDIAIDGADEIDAAGNMIKGGGGALLWEKIVATAAKKMVALVDDSKVVEKLGKFPLPVEVIPFGWRSTERHLRRALADFGYADPKIELRMRDGDIMRTDGGHYILDAHLKQIDDAPALAARLNTIPGVVEHGLFIGIAAAVVIGHPDGSSDIRHF
ncbi:ribose-5-phosphate isomerase RpiA [Fodinicola acaciae]|uniref:ribose-5-phosphate isomerase RpiA n=1 Tax=Fodinicola acaciae TaxID=2681555 RepID=UPI0013D0052B|nr:ribose-5-phosphate isomerase RpiA [Fodinicola acaciae]